MTFETIQAERIASLDELAALRPEWEAVQAACPTKHVLLDHRWVYQWWRHFGPGKAMHTVVLRRGREAVGVVPLVISRGWEAFPSRQPALQIADDYRHLPGSRWRWMPIRRLTFPLNLPSGNLRAHFLLATDGPVLVDALLDYCTATAREWDVAVFEGLPAPSGQVEQLRTRTRASTLQLGGSRFTRTLLRAHLPTTMEALLASRSGRFRRGVRKEFRRAERRTAALGTLTVRTYRGGEIDAGIDLLFAIEGQSWKVDNTKGRDIHLHLDEQMRAFHRAVARAFAATDQAQVMLLAIGERAAAALYSLERDGVTACILTYLAADLADRVTTAPLWHAFLEQAIARGLREVDFNGYTRNLEKWADGAAGYSRVVLFNRRPYSRALAAIDSGARWLARRLGQGGSRR